MPTIASLAERLDMSAEDAVEKLRYMFYEVDDVNTDISDEEFDLLIDIDDDPSVADTVRNRILSEREKAEKAAAKKKAPAKAKAKVTDDPPPEKMLAEVIPSEPEVEETVTADILPDVSAEILPDTPAEILPDTPATKPAKSKKTKEVTEDSGPKIIIGSAIAHEEHRAEVVRADGTHIDVQDVDLADIDKPEPKEEEDSTAAFVPDPKVVAEVIRQNEERINKKKRVKEAPAKPSTPEALFGKEGQKKAPKQRAPQATGLRKTGKTARKRLKKAERMRQEETLRRSAAAAVREYQAGGMDGGVKKRKKKKSSSDEGAVEIESIPVINVDENMTVEALANAMELDTTDIILELMERGIMATKNQTVSMDLIRQIAEPQGYEVSAVIPEEEDVMAEEPDPEGSLKPRAPVITVMGHVDHGKTSFLDQIRKASVAQGEAGGITQHIAAYEVKLPQGDVIFLDTPGHEAFTAMRARGARITDVVVLVVAADDGLMPQTIEAINHAKAGEVPIVVAINKCDKPDAQPDRIRQELANYDLLDEAWGGKTIIKEISALNGDGIQELTELLVLETELLELTANSDKKARGTVIESEMTKGQGPVSWVLVQSGTLKVGDIFLCGETYGRVRAMHNTAGDMIEEAGPSTPVVVQGFNQTASSGDQFLIVNDEKIARSISDKRTHHAKLKSGPSVQHVTLEDFFAQLQAGEQTSLNILVKADMQGSIDVLRSTLPDIGNDEVKVNMVHSGVGAINESDILLASASNAVVLGFHTISTPKADSLAQTEGVDIRTYRVIYEMVDDIRKSIEGMLTPDENEVITGHAEIRAIFKASSLGNIAGCMQLDGETKRDAMARVIRNKEVVWTGKVETVRRDKEQVSSVQTGFECGIKLKGNEDIQEKDIIETYKIEQVAKKLG